MEFEIGQIRSGDIIFVRSSPASKTGTAFRGLNIHGQRFLAALRLRERIGLSEELPGHSHVMLGLDGGSIIHADGKTVALEGVEEALKFGSDHAHEFAIFRRNGLDPAVGGKIGFEATRFLQRQYSFSRYLRPRPAPEDQDSTQFCSRLVAMAYRQAGIRLTKISENRVLPLDLWKICQGKDWSDVTAEFISDTEWPTLARTLKPIDFPGLGQMDFEGVMRNSGKTMRGAAENNRKIANTLRASADRAVEVERLMSEHADGHLKLMRLVRLQPSTIDDVLASKICRVLEQLPSLMTYAKLPDIRFVVRQSPIVPGGDDDADRPMYAGIPSHNEILRLRERTEERLILSYLLMVATGLTSICSYFSDIEELPDYRAVDFDYVKNFLNALPMATDEEVLIINDSDFAWVAAESNPKEYRAIAQVAATAWKYIDMLRISTIENTANESDM